MKILFRTDASLKIGTGHLMRCLTLAESLREEGAEVAFVCRVHPGNLIGILRERGFGVHELSSDNTSDRNLANKKKRLTVEDYEDWLGCTQEEDAQTTLKVVGKGHYNWLIVDHYALDERWESQLRPITQKLMVIDDLANRQHDCDLLLDQNYFVDSASRYESLIPASALRFLGPEYALLRPEFAVARSQQQRRTSSSQIRRVFVFLGGTDPDNITGLVLKALSDPALQHLEVDIVLGSTNPHREHISILVAQRPKTQLHVQVSNIAELMAKADLAIGSGGATTWERLSLGLPSLVVIIAENQRALSEVLHQRGWIVELGNSRELTFKSIYDAVREQIKKRSENSLPSSDCSIVDGQGTERVTNCLTKGIAPENWVLREAKQKDCSLYWEWVNEAEVRKQAFIQEMISWENHLTWFQKRLDDKQTMLVLAISEYGPIGQVRFEQTDEKVSIDYSLGRAMRGYGHGKFLMQSAIGFCQKRLTGTLRAEVKITNFRSISIFKELGFKEINNYSDEKEISCFQLQLSPVALIN
jgi:UDP-2,4-diacetamido-2,4,6-trideoxy-beta-L-altropyranose hydrolase